MALPHLQDGVSKGEYAYSSLPQMKFMQLQ